MEQQAVLGIDISKRTFDAELRTKERARHKVFDNNQAGFAELAKWIAEYENIGSVHACMEATGFYWMELAIFLHESGVRVSVVNPARVWGYRKSELVRSKTDKLDAGVIARFCAAVRPDVWIPPRKNVRKLKEMVRHAGTLQELIVDEKNRLQNGFVAKEVVAACNKHLKFLEQTLTLLWKQINGLVRHDTDLRHKHALLASIPGIGEDTATVILGEMFSVGEFRSSRALVCYAGLAPRQRTSGSSIRGRSPLSKVGNSRIRKALYFPALTVWRDRSMFNEFCSAMEVRGKRKMEIVGALMRKILALCYAVLKSGQVYNVNYPHVANWLEDCGLV